MAVEKGLYSAPIGIEEAALEQEEDLEIEIVNPEMVTLDDGSVEVTIIPDADVGDIIDFGDSDTQLVNYITTAIKQETDYVNEMLLSMQLNEDQINNNQIL